MKKKCVIQMDCGANATFYKGIETVPLLGRMPIWTDKFAYARIFESKAAAKDHLKGYWFDGCRNRCSIVELPFQ